VLILATILVIWLAIRLWMVVLILVIALIIAGTFNPVIASMEKRGIKRHFALTMVFGGVVLVAAALIFFTLPPLIDQVTQMVQSAPAAQTRLIGLLNERAATVPLAHAVQSVDLERTFATAERSLVGSAKQALLVFGSGVTALVLSIYLLADGKRAQGVLYAIVPRDYHMRLARILQNLETIVGGYMRGQIVTSAAFGLFTFALLVACGVPNALPLAIFAAVADVIPFIGGFLIIPAAVLSALPRGLAVAIIVLVALTLYIEFESRVLVPRIYGHVLRLSSSVVILALVAGGTLMGVMGAMLALPIAAGLQMILLELRVDMPGDDHVDRQELARHAKTEATYEQMSAGATAPDAGEIARNLAHDLRDADLVTAAKASNGGSV